MTHFHYLKAPECHQMCCAPRIQNPLNNWVDFFSPFPLLPLSASFHHRPQPLCFTTALWNDYFNHVSEYARKEKRKRGEKTEKKCKERGSVRRRRGGGEGGEPLSSAQLRSACRLGPHRYPRHGWAPPIPVQPRLTQTRSDRAGKVTAHDSDVTRSGGGRWKGRAFRHIRRREAGPARLPNMKARH